MQVKVDPSVIGQIRWHDYAIRFLFGGLITVGAGIIALGIGFMLLQVVGSVRNRAENRDLNGS